MDDLIIVAVLVLAIGAAVVYIIKEKKKGAKCIGCPSACTCSAKNAAKQGSCSGCGSNSSCGEHTEEKK